MAAIAGSGETGAERSRTRVVVMSVRIIELMAPSIGLTAMSPGGVVCEPEHTSC